MKSWLGNTLRTTDPVWGNKSIPAETARSEASRRVFSMSRLFKKRIPYDLGHQDPRRDNFIDLLSQGWATKFDE